MLWPSSSRMRLGRHGQFPLLFNGSTSVTSVSVLVTPVSPFQPHFDPPRTFEPCFASIGVAQWNVVKVVPLAQPLRIGPGAHGAQEGSQLVTSATASLIAFVSSFVQPSVGTSPRGSMKRIEFSFP